MACNRTVAAVAIGKPEPHARKASHWQQATIEIMRCNHSVRTLVIKFNRSRVNIGRPSTPQSLYYCFSAPLIHIIVLRAHPVRGESCIQRNTTRAVATQHLFQKKIGTIHPCEIF